MYWNINVIISSVLSMPSTVKSTSIRKTEKPVAGQSPEADSVLHRPRDLSSDRRLPDPW